MFASRRFILASAFFIMIFFSMLFVSCSRSPSSSLKKSRYTFAIPSRWQYTQLYEGDKNLVGFLSDFAFLLGQKAGITVKLVIIEPDDAPALFDNGSIDGYFTALPKNPMTERRYLFSEPVFINGTVMVVAQDSKFKTLEDLENAEIAFERSQGATNTMGAHASWLLRPYENAPKALRDISQGSLDGVILNYMQARLLMKSFFKYRFRILLPPLTSQNIHLLVKRGGSEELVEVVNHYRADIVESGEYHELMRYWNIDIPLEEEQIHNTIVGMQR